MKTLTGLLALTLAASALTGCSENTAPTSTDPAGTTDETPAAPNVPPPDVFAFDFHLFDTPEARAAAGDLDRAAGAMSGREFADMPSFSAGALADLPALGTDDLSRTDADAPSHLNWLNAAIRVLYLNVVLTDALTPPATVLAIALHQHPTYEGQGTFLWSFDYTDASTGAEASVRLYGTIDTISEIVSWQMIVSSTEEGLVDFLWFEGETSLVTDSGYLVFHEQDDREVARMEWSVDGDHRTLRFDNIDDQSDDVGDFVRYLVDGDDIEVRVHDDSTDMDIVIEWNETTHAGSIVAPDYNDGVRGCWDEQLLDVDCAGEIG